ncbi:MAG TPA: rhodanese-like domain-containing protein, partial [Anaerolineales bacterium]|nr:rhodanese-like domain-containing protein [Anaerolineales bacterium]
RLRKPAAPQSNSRAWLLILGGLLLIGLTAAAIFLNQGPAAKVAASNPAAEISVAEAAEKYAAGVFLLDVRTPEEWTEVHIPNTTLIPLDELQARLSELPQNAEIVVVCRSGNRSQQGRDILREAGFEQVSSMAGGIREWSSQGHPTVSGS